MNKNKIYICHTLYHIFITLFKTIDSKKNENISIAISDTVPNRTEVINNLKESKLFTNIYEIDEKNITLPKINGILDRITYFNKVNSSIRKHINFDIESYKDIYIYNDNTKIGYYLITSKIRYNLLEDALNSYRIIDQYVDINYSKKSRLASLLNLTILPYGQSKYAKSIEVTSIEGIKIPINKVYEFDNNQIINNLSKDEKKLIYNIFYKDKFLNLDRSNSYILILTQPLYEDKLVNSEKSQIEVYRSIVDLVNKSDYKIIIKPHPRDNINYDGLFENVEVISKNIPIEIFNFNESLRFSKSITISSTSIHGIKFIKERVVLGIEYIDKFKY